MKEIKHEYNVQESDIDVAGVMNDYLYVKYLEDARHRFMSDIGANFEEMAANGIIMTNAQITLKYKTTLTKGDSYTITTSMDRKKIRFIFTQKIHNQDGKLCGDAEVVGVCLVNGRPKVPAEIETVWTNYSN